MVHFNDIVAPQALATEVSTNGKKPLFQKIAQLAASAYGLNASVVSEALFERERLGSTGFGGGVAIPHAKIPGLDRMRGVVVLLNPRLPSTRSMMRRSTLSSPCCRRSIAARNI